jgi:hypothetical protein
MISSSYIHDGRSALTDHDIPLDRRTASHGNLVPYTRTERIGCHPDILRKLESPFRMIWIPVVAVSVR